MYTPDTDGINHINIYSKGNTSLGRMLSNFAHTPFGYPPYGDFASVEAFWYYYLTGCQHEDLRNLHGYNAKARGMEYAADRKDKDGVVMAEDREVILGAIREKISQHPFLLRSLWASSLPFTHYYAYRKDDGWNLVFSPQYDWMIAEIERQRGLWKSFEISLMENIGRGI